MNLRSILTLDGIQYFLPVKNTQSSLRKTNFNVQVLIAVYKVYKLKYFTRSDLIRIFDTVKSKVCNCESKIKKK